MAKAVSIPVWAQGTEYKVSIMKQGKQFLVQIDGNNYGTFTTGANSNFLFVNEDLPIEIYGEQFVLAVRGTKYRMVKDGRYIDNGEEFFSAKPLPKYLWVFYILNIALVGVGGLLGALIGILGINISMRLQNKNLSTAANIAANIGITLGCWVVYFILGTIFVTLIGSLVA